MKKLVSITAAALATGLIAAPMAMAASAADHAGDVAAGVIQKVDMASGTVTLDNNRTFKLPADYSGPKLKVGQKVSIDWRNELGAKEVTRVTPRS